MFRNSLSPILYRELCTYLEKSKAKDPRSGVRGFMSRFKKKYNESRYHIYEYQFSYGPLREDHTQRMTIKYHSIEGCDKVFVRVEFNPTEGDAIDDEFFLRSN